MASDEIFKEINDFGQKTLNEMMVSDTNPFNANRDTLYQLLYSQLKDGIFIQLKTDIDTFYRCKIEYEMTNLGLKMLFPNMETANTSKLASLLIGGESKMQEMREKMMPLMMLFGLAPSSGI